MGPSWSRNANPVIGPKRVTTQVLPVRQGHVAHSDAHARLRYRGDVDEPTCPRCQGIMAAKVRGGVSIIQCRKCEGIFLDRSELGMLIEAENDWHRSSGPRTEPLPRITADMTAPPTYSATVRARSFLDDLFG